MKIISYRLFLRALANHSRLRIVELLRRHPRHVNEIAKDLGLEQSRVSHNLRCLLDCGFVKAEWSNGNKVYTLEKDIREILGLMDMYITRYESHLRKCGVLESVAGKKVDDATKIVACTLTSAAFGKLP